MLILWLLVYLALVSGLACVLAKPDNRSLYRVSPALGGQMGVAKKSPCLLLLSFLVLAACESKGQEKVVLHSCDSKFIRSAYKEGTAGAMPCTAVDDPNHMTVGLSTAPWREPGTIYVPDPGDGIMAVVLKRKTDKKVEWLYVDTTEQNGSKRGWIAAEYVRPAPAQP